MKKTFLFISLAAAMFASCTNDEIVEMSDSRAIGFSSFVNKTTRGAASDITAGNISAFSVWSWQNEKLILSGEEVSKTVGNAETLESGWSYANTQYWAPGCTYNFYAVAPLTGMGNDTWTYAANGKDGGVINLVSKDGLTDLLYDGIENVACTDASAMGAQQFEFAHVLSRVRFGFTESFANENVTVVVSNLKVNGIQINGLYDGDGWTTQAETGSYLFDTDGFDGADDYGFSTAGSAKTYSAHLYMIPCTQSFTVTFDVTAYQDGKQIVETNSKTVVVDGFTMQSGKSYEFVTNFDAKNTGEDEDSMNPIKFTCDVSGWTETWTSTSFDTPAGN